MQMSAEREHKTIQWAEVPTGKRSRVNTD